MRARMASSHSRLRVTAVAIGLDNLGNVGGGGAAAAGEVADDRGAMLQVGAVATELTRVAELLEAVGVALPAEEGAADGPPVLDPLHLVEVDEAAPEGRVG